VGFSIWPSPPIGLWANRLGRHVIGGKREEERQGVKGTELGLYKDCTGYKNIFFTYLAVDLIERLPTFAVGLHNC
jgi:hypothetical protein